MTKKLYISQLSETEQENIKNDLFNYLYQEYQLTDKEMKEVLQSGMNSKISDLQDIIKIK